MLYLLRSIGDYVKLEFSFKLYILRWWVDLVIAKKIVFLDTLNVGMLWHGINLVLEMWFLALTMTMKHEVVPASLIMVNKNSCVLDLCLNHWIEISWVFFIMAFPPCLEGQKLLVINFYKVGFANLMSKLILCWDGHVSDLEGSSIHFIPSKACVKLCCISYLA